METVLNQTKTILLPLEIAWNRTLTPEDLDIALTQTALRQSLLLHHFLPQRLDSLYLTAHALANNTNATRVESLALEFINFKISSNRRLCFSSRPESDLGCVVLADVVVAGDVIVHFVDSVLVPQSFIDRREQLGETRRCNEVVYRNHTVSTCCPPFFYAE